MKRIFVFFVSVFFLMLSILFQDISFAEMSVNFKDVKVVAFIIDPNTGNIVKANNAASLFYGYSVDELQRMRIQEINMLSPKDVEREYQLARDESRSYFIFPHRLASGEVRTVEVYSSPFLTSSGSSLLLSIIHDVQDKAVIENELLIYQSRLKELVGIQTEKIIQGHKRERWIVISGMLVFFGLLFVVSRKHQQAIFFQKKFEIEQQCKDILERFEFLVQHAHDIILLIDEEGRIAEANIEAARAYGYSRDELLTMTIRELRDNDDSKISDSIQSDSSLKSGYMYFGVHIRKDGDKFPIESSVSVIHINEKPHFQHIIRDISERKRMEEERQKIIELLHKANDDKDKLFSIIAHDLRSPLCAIQSLTQIVGTEQDSFTEEELARVMKELHRSIKNLLALLDDLLQWARLSQGGLDCSLKPCVLSIMVQECIEVAKHACEKKNIHLVSDIPSKLMVLADESMINTVIRNLLFNAIKFSHRGGTVSVSASAEGDAATVVVRDNGIGIEQQALPRLFVIDNSKRQCGTEGEKGTGLGLLLCKEFVENHGGRIFVESVPGQGTSVSFTLQLPHGGNSSTEF